MPNRRILFADNADPSDFQNFGWKIHLSTHRDPRHPVNRKISETLEKHFGVAFLKHGSSGSQPGKGTAIWVGHRDAVDDIAQVLAREVPEIPEAYGVLPLNGAEVIPGDRRFFARFNAGNKCNNAILGQGYETTAQSQDVFLDCDGDYGALGLPYQLRPVAPYHTKIAACIQDDWDKHNAYLDKDSKRNARTTHHVRENAHFREEFKRSFCLLTAMCGDFFTGTECRPDEEPWWEMGAGVQFSKEELAEMRKQVPSGVTPLYQNGSPNTTAQMAHHHRLRFNPQHAAKMSYPVMRRRMLPSDLWGKPFKGSKEWVPLGEHSSMTEPRKANILLDYPSMDIPDRGRDGSDPVNQPAAPISLVIYHGADFVHDKDDKNLLAKQIPKYTCRIKPGVSERDIEFCLKHGNSLSTISDIYSEFDVDGKRVTPTYTPGPKPTLQIS